MRFLWVNFALERLLLPPIHVLGRRGGRRYVNRVGSRQFKLPKGMKRRLGQLMSILRFDRFAASMLPVLVLAILIGFHSEARSNSVAECQTAFQNAPAWEDCVSPTFTAVGTTCNVVASCGITATVTRSTGNTTHSWSPSLNERGSLSSIETLDICFTASSTQTSGFTVSVEFGCSTSQVNSGAAKGGALSVTD